MTNVEYEAFVEAGGYTDAELKKWWRPEGLDLWDAYKNRREHPEKVSVAAGERFDEPYLWKLDRWGAPNQPVIGVCWHEAMAYCRWLTEHLSAQGLSWRKDGLEARLPRDAEWEAVAIGDEDRVVSQVFVVELACHPGIEATELRSRAQPKRPGRSLPLPDPDARLIPG